MTPIENAQQALQAHLRDKGLKSTRQRDVILETLFGLETHVSIEALLKAVQERMPGVGYATVYRTLKLFVEIGVAQERHFNEGMTCYEPVLTDEHHDHLICTTCGTIFEFEDPIIEARQSEIAAQHGLRLRSHRHEIYGDCQAPQSRPHRVARQAR